MAAFLFLKKWRRGDVCVEKKIAALFQRFEPDTLPAIPECAGGSLFHLQKVLGHTSLEMVRRYANLVTADLQAVLQRVGLLAGASFSAPE